MWGLAVALARVPGAVWLAARTDPEVTFGTPDPGTGQILGLAFVELMVFLFLALACTAAAGLSARACAPYSGGKRSVEREPPRCGAALIKGEH
jgi:disulfide bond formation protein DsbB